MPRKTDSLILIDKNLGARVRDLRVSLGWSRQMLAPKIGITHQQLQKYEKGTNRISAGRLFKISKIFKMPIAEFFEDFEKDISNESGRAIELGLMRNFRKIKNESQKVALSKMVKSMADN